MGCCLVFGETGNHQVVWPAWFLFTTACSWSLWLLGKRCLNVCVMCRSSQPHVYQAGGQKLQNIFRRRQFVIDMVLLCRSRNSSGPVVSVRRSHQQWQYQVPREGSKTGKLGGPHL